MIVNPYRAVSFKESAIRKALEVSGFLIADTKYDGVRGNIIVNPLAVQSGTPAASSATVLSRSNKPIRSLNLFDYMKRQQWAAFQRDWMYPNGFILDGEFMVKGETFQAGSGILRRKAQIDHSSLVVVIYGVLPIEMAYHNDDVPVATCMMQIHAQLMVERLKVFFPEIDWKVAESEVIYDYDDLVLHYNQMRKEGHEGLIVKDPLGHYLRGKRTGWWKMKEEVEADGHVVSYNWGTSGLKNEGLIIGFEIMSEDGHLVNANGLTEAQMDQFTRQVVEEGVDMIGWAAQFKFMERTDELGFRHPSFDCWRGTEDNPKVKI